MHRLRVIAVGLAASLGLAFALAGAAVPAAQASTLDYICNGNSYCWVNNGLEQNIGTSTTGTGWKAVDSGQAWNGHEMYLYFTGSGTCAIDDGSGYVLFTTNFGGIGCIVEPETLYYLAASGAIVNEYTSGQLGHLYCLIRLSGGNIGNFECPSGTPPAAAKWAFKPS